MSDERLVDLETRIAHQDQTLIELNEVITDQQARIMRLEKLCASVADRVQSIAEAMPDGAAGDERPPHY
jgi:SlyX protein